MAKSWSKTQEEACATAKQEEWSIVKNNWSVVNDDVEEIIKGDDAWVDFVGGNVFELIDHNFEIIDDFQQDAGLAPAGCGPAHRSQRLL